MDKEFAIHQLISIIWIASNLQSKILHDKKTVDKELLLQLQSIDFNLACIKAEDD